MGLFDDAELGALDFEEGSETSSNVEEGEEQPGQAGQANPATGSAFDLIDTSNIAPQPTLLAFVEGCCEERRLSDEAKENALQTARLPLDYMVMRLFTHVLELEQGTSKTQVEDFLRSPTFKQSIKQRIQGGLLDPYIPFYVRGCTSRFVRHMRENPGSYEIPLMVQKRLLPTKKFSSAVGDILSGFRGEIRRKILGSIEDEADIASTGEKLAIEGYMLSEDHLKQFALLRYLSEDYMKSEANAQAKKAAENANAQAAQARNQGRGKKHKVDATPQKALAFWTYIDTQMLRFRQYPIAKRNDLLKRVLRRDRKKYPDPTGSPRYFSPASRLLVSQWQSDASHAVQVMAEYTLTAAQEGQEVPPAEPDATHEDEGPANQEDPPQEEEEGPLSGDEDNPNGQDGTGTNDNFQDNPSSPFDQERNGPHGAETALALPRDVNSGSALGNHTPQGQRVPSNSVGPVRGTASQPQNGRVITLAQTSRNSPFPLSSRTSTPHAPQPLVSTPRTTRSTTRNALGVPANASGQRLLVIEPYNPVDSETAAATVGI